MKDTDRPDPTDLTFQALASRPRRLIMDLVKRQPGCSVKDVAEHFDISRIGVMKHIQILVEARLIVSLKSGRTRQLYFNAAPIQMIYDRWSDEYASFWATQTVDLKAKIERKNKKKKPRRRNSRPAKPTKKTSSRD